MTKTGGWYNDRPEHGLAARGIKTRRGRQFVQRKLVPARDKSFKNMPPSFNDFYNKSQRDREYEWEQLDRKGQLIALIISEEVEKFIDKNIKETRSIEKELYGERGFDEEKERKNYMHVISPHVADNGAVGIRLGIDGTMYDYINETAIGSELIQRINKKMQSKVGGSHAKWGGYYLEPYTHSEWDVYYWWPEKY